MGKHLERSLQGSKQICAFRTKAGLPGGPGVKTLHFHSRAYGFDPWSRKFHMQCGQKKKGTKADVCILLSMHQSSQPGQPGLWSKQGVMCGGEGEEEGGKQMNFRKSTVSTTLLLLKIAIHPFKVNSYVWHQNA